MKRRVKTIPVPYESIVNHYKKVAAAEAKFAQTYLSPHTTRKERQRAMDSLRSVGQKFEQLIAPATRNFKTFTGLRQHLDAAFPSELEENARNIRHEKEHTEAYAKHGVRLKPTCTHVTIDDELFHLPGITVVDDNVLKGDPVKFARAIADSVPQPEDEQSLLDTIIVNALALKE